MVEVDEWMHRRNNTVMLAERLFATLLLRYIADI